MADKEKYLEAAASYYRTFNRPVTGRVSWALHKVLDTVLDGGDPLEVQKAYRILAGDLPHPDGIVELG